MSPFKFWITPRHEEHVVYNPISLPWCPRQPDSVLGTGEWNASPTECSFLLPSWEAQLLNPQEMPRGCCHFCWGYLVTGILKAREDFHGEKVLFNEQPSPQGPRLAPSPVCWLQLFPFATQRLLHTQQDVCSQGDLQPLF